MSKAVSSIPTCGYVDRRDIVDHHVKERAQWKGYHLQKLIGSRTGETMASVFDTVGQEYRIATSIRQSVFINGRRDQHRHVKVAKPGLLHSAPAFIGGQNVAMAARPGTSKYQA